MNSHGVWVLDFQSAEVGEINHVVLDILLDNRSRVISDHADLEDLCSGDPCWYAFCFFFTYFY